MAFDSQFSKRPPSTHRFRWRVPFTYLLVVALCTLGIPVGVFAPATAQAASVLCASTSEIAAMLDEGPYVPGEAIIVVEKTPVSHPVAIDDATELMEADATSYEQATGEDAPSTRGVVIEHVVREGADTAELLAELASDPHVLSGVTGSHTQRQFANSGMSK